MMRALIMASMTALVLSGLPPAPPPPAAAQPSERAAPAPDPDRICAPFLDGFRADYGDARGYGRRSTGRLAPPPPPPPPSPPPVARTEEQSVAVTGQRVVQPNMTSPSPSRVTGPQSHPQP